jgi:hypothetical protein
LRREEKALAELFDPRAFDDKLNVYNWASPGGKIYVLRRVTRPAIFSPVTKTWSKKMPCDPKIDAVFEKHQPENCFWEVRSNGLSFTPVDTFLGNDQSPGLFRLLAFFNPVPTKPQSGGSGLTTVEAQAQTEEANTFFKGSLKPVNTCKETMCTLDEITAKVQTFFSVIPECKDWGQYAGGEAPVTGKGEEADSLPSPVSVAAVCPTGCGALKDGLGTTCHEVLGGEANGQSSDQKVGAVSTKWLTTEADNAKHGNLAWCCPDGAMSKQAGAVVKLVELSGGRKTFAEDEDEEKPGK